MIWFRAYTKKKHKNKKKKWEKLRRTCYSTSRSKESVWHVKRCTRLHLKFELSNKTSYRKFSWFIHEESMYFMLCRMSESPQVSRTGWCGVCGENGVSIDLNWAPTRPTDKIEIFDLCNRNESEMNKQDQYCSLNVKYNRTKHPTGPIKLMLKNTRCDARRISFFDRSTKICVLQSWR